MGVFFRRRMMREQNKPVAVSRRGMFERHVISAGVGGAQNYLLVCVPTRAAVLIDARGEAGPILDEIRRQRVRMRMILLTHGHADCWHALLKLRDVLGVPIGIHLDDADMLPLTPNFALSHEQRLAFDIAELTVLHTPGHTPGSVCLLGDDNLFTGDVLSAGAIGDTSTELGNRATLAASLRERILTLPGNTGVFPAYGPATTIDAERETFAQWEANGQ
jgi:glyoxylase-like metal-dependent hydrolase (beta-lactamase superfamily II)